MYPSQYPLHQVRQHLWTGGVVMSPTTAAVGENGPEMVVPLSRLSEVLQSTGNTPAQQASSSSPITNTSNKPNVTIQNLIGTLNLSVGTTNGTMSDQDRDALASDIITMIDNAIQTLAGKLN